MRSRRRGFNREALINVEHDHRAPGNGLLAGAEGAEAPVVGDGSVVGVWEASGHQASGVFDQPVTGMSLPVVGVACGGPGGRFWRAGGTERGEGSLDGPPALSVTGLVVDGAAVAHMPGDPEATAPRRP